MPVSSDLFVVVGLVSVLVALADVDDSFISFVEAFPFCFDDDVAVVCSFKCASLTLLVVVVIVAFYVLLIDRLKEDRVRERETHTQRGKRKIIFVDDQMSKMVDRCNEVFDGDGGEE